VGTQLAIMKTSKGDAMRRTVLTVALFSAALAAAAQEPSQRTERLVAGPQFKKGGLHRMLWGANHRDLWTTPVELPVLDLQSYAGGLTAVRRIGHGQTQALALAGKNGVAYTFRPIVKDPVGLLPEELRETLAAAMVRDQMSSQHPAGHVIVPPLLEAAGILHNTPELVVMPDDPALGEFRADFKGLTGDLEEFAGQKGFRGALELAGEEMWKRLDAEPGTRIDSRAYLTARLVDHLVGDWDRHLNQWRWAKLPGKDKWQPIPEDRDQAFARFQGLAIAFLRGGLPLLVSFDGRYPGLHSLTYDSWPVDMRLLADLERPAYALAAKELRSRLSDDVIDAAVRRMPKAWFDKAGARTIAALKRRRDGLEAHAQSFYAFMAGQVEVRASEQDDAVEIERLADGGAIVRIALAGTPRAPYYERRFVEGETDEVRIYLLAGNDRVVTKGPKGGIAVRVIGGLGEDAIDDSAVGGLRVSDAEARTVVEKGPGTSLDTRPYTPKPNARGWWIPPRDWGRRTLFPVTRLTASSDHWAVLNVGLKSTGYGFRKDPFSDQHSLRVSYASRLTEFRGEYDGRFRFEGSRAEAGIRAAASGFEIVRFYGFGNESRAPLAARNYRVNQDQFSLEPTLSLPLGNRASFSLGGIVKRVLTHERPDSLLATARPYGIEDTTQLGGRVGLELDTTDRSGLPNRGVRIRTGGTLYPRIAGLDDAFGEVHGEASAWLSAGATLALRAGGKRVFGSYPFYEAAFLGGSSSLRGLPLQRYAGDAALHGGAELFIPVTKAFLLVPGEIGIFGLADVGRVYLDGEDSNRWHKGFGGGLYFTSPNRNNSFELSLARSEGRNGIYLRVGLALP
jgi:hypothetical protein